MEADSVTLETKVRENKEDLTCLKSDKGKPQPRNRFTIDEHYKEMTEAVKNTDGSKTSTLTGGRQSAAVEAQAQRSLVEVIGDAVVQV